MQRSDAGFLPSWRRVTDLVEFPVELGRFVVLSFGRILAEEQDQPAVVDVERVVVSVHL